jgi:ABC-type multidrug transport system permease subunit
VRFFGVSCIRKRHQRYAQRVGTSSLLSARYSDFRLLSSSAILFPTFLASIFLRLQSLLFSPGLLSLLSSPLLQSPNFSFPIFSCNVSGLLLFCLVLLSCLVLLLF